MAKNLTENPQATVSLNAKYIRTSPNPMEVSELFLSYEDAEKYAKGDENNPDERKLYKTAYGGQIIGVANGTKEVDGVEYPSYEIYIIDGDSTLKKSGIDYIEGPNITIEGDIIKARGYKYDKELDSFAEREALYGDSGTIASGFASHAEGYSKASGHYSHSEGLNTIAGATGAHTEGSGSIGTGSYSHAEGCLTGATGYGSHAEGGYTTAFGSYSHSEGGVTKAEGDYSHAEGSGTIASGKGSHTEGGVTKAEGDYSHAEGSGTIASGKGSHTEGYSTIASGKGSHTEGYSTIASGDYSHAEGGYTGNAKDEHTGNTIKLESFNIASGVGSHAEGVASKATGTGAHSEGGTIYYSGSTITNYTTASGNASHAEGEGTKAEGKASHAEGGYTTASDWASHAEGYSTIASGDYSHAEGGGTKAEGSASHAEGYKTTASGQYSHTEGFYTQTGGTGEHAQGCYNKSNSGETTDKQTIHSIGIGASDNNRKNAFEVMQNGDAYLIGAGGYDGTNPKGLQGSTALTLQELLKGLPVPTIKDEIIYSLDNESLSTLPLMYTDGYVVDNDADFDFCKGKIETDVLGTWQQFTNYYDYSREYGIGKYIPNNNSSIGYSEWYTEGDDILNDINSSDFNGYMMSEAKKSYTFESIFGTKTGNTTGDDIGFSIVNDKDATSRGFKTTSGKHFFRNTLFDIYEDGFTTANKPKRPVQSAWVHNIYGAKSAYVVYTNSPVAYGQSETIPEINSQVNLYYIPDINKLGLLTKNDYEQRGTDTVSETHDASGVINFLKVTVTNSNNYWDGINDIGNNTNDNNMTIKVLISQYDIINCYFKNSTCIINGKTGNDELVKYISRLYSDVNGNKPLIKTKTSMKNGILSIDFSAVTEYKDNGNVYILDDGGNQTGEFVSYDEIPYKSNLTIDFNDRKYTIKGYDNNITTYELPTIGNETDTETFYNSFTQNTKFMYDAFSYQNLFIRCLSTSLENKILYVNDNSTKYGFGVWLFDSNIGEYKKSEDLTVQGELQNGSRFAWNDITNKLFYNDGSNVYLVADATIPKVGPQGATGEKGQDGINGKDGKQGIQGVTGLTGPTGPTGPRGADGKDGTDGAPGTSGLPIGTVIDWYGEPSYDKVGKDGWVPCGEFIIGKSNSNSFSLFYDEFQNWSNLDPSITKDKKTYKVDKTVYGYDYLYVMRITKCNNINIPYLSNRFILGAGIKEHSEYTNDADLSSSGSIGISAGDIGGEAEVKLTAEQSGLPSHTHTNTSTGTITTTYNTNGNDYNSTAINPGNASATSSGSIMLNTTVTIDKNNAQQASKYHNNMPPYYALWKLIKVK